MRIREQGVRRGDVVSETLQRLTAKMRTEAEHSQQDIVELITQLHGLIAEFFSR